MNYPDTSWCLDVTDVDAIVRFEPVGYQKYSRRWNPFMTFYPLSTRAGVMVLSTQRDESEGYTYSSGTQPWERYNSY